MDIETAQAQKAITLIINTDTSVLLLESKSVEETVLTLFLAGTVVKNVDKEVGGGAINMTTLMTYQESSIGAVCKVSVPKAKSRKISVTFDKHNIVLYDKQEPNITLNLSKINVIALSVSFHASFSPGFSYVIATVLNKFIQIYHGCC